jgi:hypothetical protein
MVRKRGTKGQSAEVTLKSDTEISKLLGKRGIRCVGDICFTENGKIRIDLSKSKCSQELIDKLVKRVLKGAETEYYLGKRAKEVKQGE